MFLQESASISTLNQLNSSRCKAESIINYLCFFSSLLSLSVPPSPSLLFTPPHSALYSHTHTHTHTLTVMHIVAAAIDELHECTHNCLFPQIEMSTHTHQNGSFCVLVSVFSLQANTWTQTHRHTQTHTHTHTHKVIYLFGQSVHSQNLAALHGGDSNTRGPGFQTAR